MSEKSMQNFPAEELRCKCAQCSLDVEHGCDTEALYALQRVRVRFDKPMFLTSAFRCADHPVEASKTNPGTHNQGIAFDVAVPWGADRMELVRLAMEEGFKGFGFAGTFLHIDFRSTGLTSWTYS